MAEGGPNARLVEEGARNGWFPSLRVKGISRTVRITGKSNLAILYHEAYERGRLNRGIHAVTNIGVTQFAFRAGRSIMAPIFSLRQTRRREK